MKPVVEKREAGGLFSWRTTMSYTVTNALPKPVTVQLFQDGLWGDTRITPEPRWSLAASIVRAGGSSPSIAEPRSSPTAGR